VTRWLSSTIGEGLILDLRTAVFATRQRMPVAFFTRTRTGALVSRLGNDVNGAQRAFSDTFSGVITNIVTLDPDAGGHAQDLLAGDTSVAATDAAVPASPPAGSGGPWRRCPASRDAQRDDEHPDTERFSAPGATLVKLFGNPDTESREFEVRAESRPDIGVRTAMLQSVFMNSLTLMSALALTLVYGSAVCSQSVATYRRVRSCRWRCC